MQLEDLFKFKKTSKNELDNLIKNKRSKSTNRNHN
jgi:hypothetical protein